MKAMFCFLSYHKLPLSFCFSITYMYIQMYLGTNTSSMQYSRSLVDQTPLGKNLTEMYIHVYIYQYDGMPFYPKVPLLYLTLFFVRKGTWGKDDGLLLVMSRYNTVAPPGLLIFATHLPVLCCVTPHGKCWQGVFLFFQIMAIFISLSFTLCNMIFKTKIESVGAVHSPWCQIWGCFLTMFFCTIDQALSARYPFLWNQLHELSKNQPRTNFFISF